MQLLPTTTIPLFATPSLRPADSTAWMAPVAWLSAMAKMPSTPPRALKRTSSSPVIFSVKAVFHLPSSAATSSIARMLGQHGLEGCHAVLDVELLGGAGHRNDLRLGLARGHQPLDHAFAGQAPEFAVIGADIGREQLFVVLLQRRDDEHDRNAGRLGAGQRRHHGLVVDVDQHDDVEFLRDRIVDLLRLHRGVVV